MIINTVLYYIYVMLGYLMVLLTLYLAIVYLCDINMTYYSRLLYKYIKNNMSH